MSCFSTHFEFTLSTHYNTNIQILPQMQTIDVLITEWAELREHRDVTIIAKLLKKDHSQASRILNGKQKASTEDLLLIKAFYEKRKVKRKKLTKK